MTSYIAHHTKKKQILARKEATLDRLVQASAADEELTAAAEQVRDARIRVLRVQRSLIVPSGNADAKYTKIDAKIEQVREASLTAILSEFGYIFESPDDTSMFENY